jgi:hypothetical protein
MGSRTWTGEELVPRAPRGSATRGSPQCSDSCRLSLCDASAWLAGARRSPGATFSRVVSNASRVSVWREKPAGIRPAMRPGSERTGSAGARGASLRQPCCAAQAGVEHGGAIAAGVCATSVLRHPMFGVVALTVGQLVRQGAALRFAVESLIGQIVCRLSRCLPAAGRQPWPARAGRIRRWGSR